MSINNKLLYNSQITTIWEHIVDINIQAIDEILEHDDLTELSIILDSFNSSLEELKHGAYIMKTKLRLMYARVDLIHTLPVRWFNTLRSTLYHIEELYIQDYPQEISDLWDIFFSKEASLGNNLTNYLKLKEICQKETPIIRLGLR